MRDLLVLERLGMAQKTGRSRWQWCGIGRGLQWSQWQARSELQSKRPATA